MKANPTSERTQVVLLHGVGLDHRMWTPVIEALPDELDVVAPDLPGHGDAAAIATTVISLSELAEGVRGALPPRAHVVGFSLGALVAQQLAIAHAERINSLVLVSSVARRSASQRAAVLGRLEAARLDPARNRSVALQRWTGGDPSRLAPGALQYLRTVLAGTDHASFLAAYAAFARADEELWDQLPAIAVPTLAITGSDDPGSTPAMTRALAAAIPHARAEIVPGARHLLPLERPDTVARMIVDHVRSHLEHRGQAAAV